MCVCHWWKESFKSSFREVYFYSTVGLSVQEVCMRLKSKDRSSTWPCRRGSSSSHHGTCWGSTCCGCQRWRRTHGCRRVWWKTTASVVRRVNLWKQRGRGKNPILNARSTALYKNFFLQMLSSLGKKWYIIYSSLLLSGCNENALCIRIQTLFPQKVGLKCNKKLRDLSVSLHLYLAKVLYHYFASICKFRVA